MSNLPWKNDTAALFRELAEFLESDADISNYHLARIATFATEAAKIKRDVEEKQTILNHLGNRQ